MAAEIKKNNKPGLIFDSDLRLDRTASNADDTTFFRIATDDELNRYLNRSVQEGLLLLDESQRGRLIETILATRRYSGTATRSTTPAIPSACCL